MAMPPPQSPPRSKGFVYTNHGIPSSPPPPPPTSSPPQQPQMQFSPPPQFPPLNPTIDDVSGAGGAGIGGFGINTGSGDGGISADDSFAFKSPEPLYRKVTRYINIRYQLLLDASTPHWAARWTFSLVILLIFMIRIIVAQGWYVICYGLSIYYLNLFIGFLSPKIDPAFQVGGEFDFDDPNDSASGPMLPTRANDEFRPFIRRLPEFKFWLSATTATLISLFLTLFEVFDLPVFWPILLLYFILLFVSTMRQQIKHMLKYGYVPWDKGKKKYRQSNQEPSSLFSTTI